MTVRRLSTRLLLQPEEVSPSRDDFEVVGVFNPGAVRIDGEVTLLVRVAERPREQRPGFTGLPRWDVNEGLTIDWVPSEQLEAVDSRVVKQKYDGRVRLTFISHLRTARCGDGLSVRELSGPILLSEVEAEEYGVEDPRITQIGDRCYITYVAVSRHGPATALTSTVDFRTFERHGIIFCPENKDVMLFPEKFGGSYVALHRPVCGTPFTRPEMWIAKSPDLMHWGSHSALSLAGSEWQSGRVGGGAPPIRVRDGWLAIYHGNRQPTHPGDVGAYFGAAILLDFDNPTQIRKQSNVPFLVPEADFEVNGFVPNVVFPTGIVRDEDLLLLYYGAADACTAVAEFSVQELLDSMVESHEFGEKTKPQASLKSEPWRR